MIGMITMKKEGNDILSNKYLIHAASVSVMGKNTGYVVAGQGSPDDRGMSPLRRKIMRVIEGHRQRRGRGHRSELRQASACQAALATTPEAPPRPPAAASS
jgi:hypothetical protein